MPSTIKLPDKIELLPDIQEIIEEVKPEESEKLRKIFKKTCLKNLRN